MGDFMVNEVDLADSFRENLEGYTSNIDIVTNNLYNTELCVEVTSDYYDDEDEFYEILYDISYDFKYDFDKIDEWETDIYTYDNLEEYGYLDAEIFIYF